MTKTERAFSILILIACVAGCDTPANVQGGAKPEVLSARDKKTDDSSTRMLIWKASLRIQVRNIGDAVSQATRLAEEQGGFVEEKSDNAKNSASLTLRVPAKLLQATVSKLETFGTVLERNVKGQDVTAKYIDTDARLKNKIVLRDRLKQLLDKAVDVKDILAIESELNRVQSDIDAMEAEMKALKGDVDFSTINLTLERKPVLGPLGYLFKGLGWGIEKLFVLRD